MTAERAESDEVAWQLTATSPGFEVRDESRVLRVLEQGEIEAPGDLSGARLVEDGYGFRIERRDAGHPPCRTSRLDDASSHRDLLASDGRLFRLALRGGREPGWLLRGQESPGAYVEVLPQPEHWTFRIEPAGRELERLEELLILVAAEVLAIDR